MLRNTRQNTTFAVHIVHLVYGHILGILGTDSASTVPHYTRYTYLVVDQAFSSKVSIPPKS